MMAAASELEIGNAIGAVQLRIKGNVQGTYLRLDFPAKENTFVWYEATAMGFTITTDDDAEELEAAFQGLHQ